MKKPFCFRTRRAALMLSAVVFAGFSAANLAQAQTWEQEREATRLNNEGVDYAKIGKRAEAIERYNRALAANPKDEVILHNRAVSYIELGQFDKALQDANELVSRFPNSPEQLTLRGYVYLLLQKIEESRRDYQKAIQLDPDNLETLEEYVGMLRSSRFESEYEFERLRYQGLKAETGHATERDQQWTGELRSINDLSALKINVGEIRLHGRVHKIVAEKGTVTVEVAGFGVPSGRFRALGQPKMKLVKAGTTEIEWPKHGTLPMQLLKPGDFLVLIGADKKTEFLPRRILLAATGRQTVKERFQGEKFLDLVEKDIPVEPNEAIQEAALIHAEEDQPWPLTFIAHDETGPVLFTAASEVLGSMPRSRATSQTPLATIQTLVRKVPASIQWNHSEQKRPSLPVASVHLGQGAHSEAGTVAVRLKTAPSKIPLAKERPKRGELVWIAGNYGGDRSYVPTTVIWSDSQRLVLWGTYGDEDGRQEGSAVLNAKGEAVGMVLNWDDESAFAAPVDTLRKVAKTPAIPTAAKKP